MIPVVAVSDEDKPEKTTRQKKQQQYEKNRSNKARTRSLCPQEASLNQP